MTLGVMLLLHRRERLLATIAEQLDALRAAHTVRLVTNEDRCPPEVAAHIAALRPDRRFSHDCSQGRHPVVQQFLLDALADWSPDWIYFQCDDHVFSAPGLDEFLAALERPVQVIRAPRTYLWDGVVREIFPSLDPLAWRWTSGQRFDPRRQIVVPPDLYDEALREGRVYDMTHPILDYGFDTPEDRRACLAEYRRAGRFDRFFQELAREAARPSHPLP